MGSAPTYLEPYVSATREHGAGFGSLLWNSPASQAARFAALTRLYDFRGRSILDAGCGRGDFLDYLHARKIEPDHYVGLEAMEALAGAAELKHHPRCTIVRADFVREPIRMFVGADAVVFCGSLNTLDDATFRETLRRAFDAAAEAIVFNFLSSTRLASARYLSWHKLADVEAFVATLTPDYQSVCDYVDGDATVIARRV